ncbi:pyridoxamine 5'-phosphate oxidase [Jatrophihabitans telluris]|uniref:Pyridoxine/pyridoxamine 5'-phosphate oxidase n=1 Tax=Jatrophihabitans telluris TaxID=2038343 RepID=A0ABY4R0M5_9ACTN|nr:pyridoxamine 5'-phosphate oxidase [Jatrophihabitans telluris]UQX89143.1 pyridoxamine 5'-phosphate oxidase [Jatrophihabitans telluris]
MTNPSAPDPLAELTRSRRSYLSGELTEDGLAAGWLEQLRHWYADAAADPRIGEPNAMQLATADGAGRPDVRTVLARGFDEAGVVFYTNYGSAKGDQLTENPAAAVVFAWLPLERQVRLRGSVAKVSPAETAAYFASRPRGAQLGAWASPQSRRLADRAELEAALAATEQRFGDAEIDPPPFWGGYRLTPTEVEFWQGREFRLHDRLRFRRLASGDWVTERLAP